MAFPWRDFRVLLLQQSYHAGLCQILINVLKSGAYLKGQIPFMKTATNARIWLKSAV